MKSFIQLITNGLETALKYTKIVNVLSDIIEFSIKRFNEFKDTIIDTNKETKTENE